MRFFFLSVYKDIRQSRLCSARLEASSGPKTNNQRGRGSVHCLLLGGLDKSRHIVLKALLERVQYFRIVL